MKDFLTWALCPALIIVLIIVTVWLIGSDRENEKLVHNNSQLTKIVSILDDENKALVQSTRIKNMGTFRVTYYCNNCPICGTNNHTADGTKLTSKMQSIAVDPSVIPNGTVVVIDGKLYIANDTGGAIEGKRIDIMVYGKTHKEVSDMGVDYFTVWAVN